MVPTDKDKETAMPRYMVERTFPDGLNVPVNAAGAEGLCDIVKANGAKRGIVKNR